MQNRHIVETIQNRRERLEQLRALEHGYHIHIIETSGDTLEVDTPEDLRRAQAFFSSH